jgi:chromosome segregation ATPase
MCARADADAKIAKLETRISSLEKELGRTINEKLARLERTDDINAKLGDAVHKQNGQLASLVTKIDQLCGANVVDLPSHRNYPRDLN